jgi:hypothetical protein
MREMGTAIYRAVDAGIVREPFSAADARRALPQFADSWGTFLPKHRVGNPGANTELFVQAGRGRYRLNR